jgi:hypothetical protein
LPSGGVSVWSFSWSAGASQTTAGLLSAGVHSVLVRDRNGCTATSSIIVTQPAALSVATQPIPYHAGMHVSCRGESDAAARALPSGGVQLWTFSWTSSGGTGQTSSQVLSAGFHTVTATDRNACTASASVQVTQPAAVSVTASIALLHNGRHVSCRGDSDGQA